MKLVRVLLLITIGCNCDLSLADDDRIFIYAEQVYPLHFADNSKAGQPVRGEIAEFVEAVVREAGLVAEIRVLPWKRMLSIVNSQENTLIYSVERTVAREDQFRWIGALWPIRTSLYGLRRNYGDREWSVESLLDHRVAANVGYPIYTRLEELGFRHIVGLNESADKLTLLRQGRVDLIHINWHRASLLIPEAYNEGVGIVKVADLAQEDRMLYLVAGLKTENEIVDRLTNAYKKLRSSITFDFEKFIE